jgi:hypothetical protein
MIKFNLVDDLLNIDTRDNMQNPIYIDTDSLFIELDIDLIKQKKKAQSQIDSLQNMINYDILGDFLKLHNIQVREREDKPLLWCDFKNEYMIKILVLYSKKRYISVLIKYDKNGEMYYDIDIKGVEGKRATNAFVKKIVDDLLVYLKQLEIDDDIYTRFDILNKVIVPYRKTIFEMKNKSITDNIKYFSLPVNVKKRIDELKTVQGYYKGTLTFDICGERSWEYRLGKGHWVRVKIKDESYIPEIMRQLSKYPQIKIKNKKPNDIIRDITIPDEYMGTKIVDTLFTNVFEIDYDTYYEQLLKKISLLYRPFDEIFTDKLEGRIKKTLPKDFMIFGDESVFSYSG